MSEKKLKLYKRAVKRAADANKLVMLREIFKDIILLPFKERLKIGVRIILGKPLIKPKKVAKNDD
jgi:hypothetical protein